MTVALGTFSQQITPAKLPPALVPGLYVHIPFCFHKCHYCDFYSITRQTEERMGRYVDLILREAMMWSGEGWFGPRASRSSYGAFRTLSL